jgi:hypothetical protein
MGRLILAWTRLPQFKQMQLHVKLPAHRAGVPGNEISFFIVPLDPTYKAGLAGHLPAEYPEEEEAMVQKGYWRPLSNPF